jgi:hypothetical protein
MSFTHFLNLHQSVIQPVFHPEYGRYMLESTPGAPYTGCVRDLLLVEPNMRLRWVAVCPFQPPLFQQGIDSLWPLQGGTWHARI